MGVTKEKIRVNDIKADNIADVLNQDEEHKYYVYALCEIKDNKLIPFYIGKGTGKRVWAHEIECEIQIREISDLSNEKINKLKEVLDLDDDEFSELKEEIKKEVKESNEKYTQKLNKIETLKNEETYEKVIIKWGLTNSEAFMTEAALINLCKAQGIELTNIAEGHGSQAEKKFDIERKARTVEEFYDDYAQEPIYLYNEQIKGEFKDTVFININVGYEDCEKLLLEEGQEEYKKILKETVRGFWRVSDNKKINYVFAVYRKKIVGVFRVVKPEGLGAKKLPYILDTKRNDYPFHEKSKGRREDKEFAEELLKNNDGNIPKSYDDLTGTAKEFYKKRTNAELEAKGKKTYNYEFEYAKRFNNYIQRKYYVLEMLEDNNEYNDYIGRLIYEWTKEQYNEIKEVIKNNNQNKSNKEKIPKNAIHTQNPIRYGEKIIEKSNYLKNVMR